MGKQGRGGGNRRSPPGGGGGGRRGKGGGGYQQDDLRGLPGGKGGRPDDEEDNDSSERKHFLEVCWSCLEYGDDAKREVKRMEATFENIDPNEKVLWNLDANKWMGTLKVGIGINANFLKLLPSPDVCGAPMSTTHAQMVYRTPPGHHVEGRNASKVRTTLRQFVRDWAEEGRAERQAAYGPLIDAVQRHLPLLSKGKGKKGGGPKPRVLCPGSGLGRLPFDFSWLGYAAQGNEFSYHMILGSHLIYNRTEEPFCHTIYPYVFSTMNRAGRDDNLKPVRVPDVCPCLALTPDSDISMAAGEFVAVYEDQIQEWDAVVSAFFLDTAKNIFLYVRTIASILKPGGLFINLGPLLFHYADVEHEISIELSWEEIRPFICKYFDIVEEDRRDAIYTANPGSLMRTVFHCIFFVAKRNNEPVTGKSNPVY